MLRVEKKISIHIDGEDAEALLLVCQMATRAIEKGQAVTEFSSEEKTRALNFIRRIRGEVAVWPPKAD